MNNVIQFPNRRAQLMLLSYNKYATASTFKNHHEPRCAVDENNQTSWLSESGCAGEWFRLDLGTQKNVYAVHIKSAFVSNCNLFGSVDGKEFTLLVDQTEAQKEQHSGTIIFESGRRLRFLKLELVHDVPGCFSIDEFRVYGFGNGNVPGKVENPFAFKSSSTKATVCWNKVSTAVGYSVRFGSDPERLYNSKSVYNADSLSFDFLSGETCYYAVDSFNENGITKGDINVIHTVMTNNKIRKVQ